MSKCQKMKAARGITSCISQSHQCSVNIITMTTSSSSSDTEHWMLGGSQQHLPTMTTTTGTQGNSDRRIQVKPFVVLVQHCCTPSVVLSRAAPRFSKWGVNFASGASKKKFFDPPTFWPVGGQNIAVISLSTGRQSENS